MEESITIEDVDSFDTGSEFNRSLCVAPFQPSCPQSRKPLPLWIKKNPDEKEGPEN